MTNENTDQLESLFKKIKNVKGFTHTRIKVLSFQDYMKEISEGEIDSLEFSCPQKEYYVTLYKYDDLQRGFFASKDEVISFVEDYINDNEMDFLIYKSEDASKVEFKFNITLSK